MNQREKFLAAVIGVIALLFVGRYFWMGAQETIDTKTNQVTQLKNKLEDQELAILAGQKAQKKINLVTPRAAAKESERAKAQYEKWLIQLTNDAKIKNPSLPFISSRSGSGNAKVEDKFVTHSYSVEGEGDLTNITRLLYHFYTKPKLQRISEFTITPKSAKVEDIGQFKISMKCEYLTIPTSKDIPISIPYDKSLLDGTLADYDAEIIERNIFSRPNKPPAMDSEKVVTAHVGMPVDSTITATESDPNQKVKYTLEGDLPEGLTVDADTGKINWTGKEIGEVQFTVKATDTGLPMRSATQLVKINVVPAPPPAMEPEKFNIASQAKLTGLVSGQKGAEAWIHSLVESKTVMLKQDDELKLGDLKGKVVKVGANYVELESDGKRWTLGIDENVLDAYKRGMTD